MSTGAGSTVELRAQMSNVGAARRFVRAELTGHAPADAVDDLMLATSELVTNAFEHGSSPTVRVTVRHDPSEASVTVTSGGEHARVPAVDDWTTARADRISGRGLGIVRQVADDVDVERTPDALTITVRRRFEHV